MISRIAASLLLAWVMLLAPLAETSGMGGCPRCAEHCPMRANGASRELPCHAMSRAASKASAGCTIRATCAHGFALLPAGSSEALLVAEVMLPTLARSQAEAPAKASTPTTRSDEPPTDPPRSFVLA